MAAEVYTVNINTSPAVKSVASLEKELQEATEQLKRVEIGSDAFNELQKRVADCKGEIDTFNKTTDMMSKGFQGWGENAAKVTSGLTGGITAATAAMQLMGFENDNVLKGIAKLQQLMAFSQGIASLKDLSEGFGVLKGAITAAVASSNALKAALISSGVGAAVVAVGALASNWDKVKRALGFATEAQKDYNAELQKHNDLAEKTKAANDLFVEALSKSNLTPIQRLEEEYAHLQRANANLRKEQEETFAKVGNATISARNKLKKYDEEISKNVGRMAEITGELAKQRKLQEEINKLNDKYKEPEKTETKAEPAQEEEREEWVKVEPLTAFINQTVSAEEELLGLKVTAKELNDEQASFFINQANEVDFLRSATANLQDTMGRLSESSMGLSGSFGNVITDLQAGFNIAADSIEQTGEVTTEAAVKMAASGVQAMGSLFNALSAECNTGTKEGFEKSKKYQIAATTMNAVAGIANAWMSAMSPANSFLTMPGQIALGAAQTAATAALAAVQIAKIKSQTFSGSSSSGSLSGTAASSTLVAPTQYSTAVEGANIESAVSDSRVYVVESDISNTSKRVAVQESENRY